MYKAYLAGFSVACLLALIAGFNGVLAWGLALFFCGLLAALKPPRSGLGPWGDLAVLGLLVGLLLSFLPLFYWPQPDWRVIATESIGIQLPGILSVRPWSSVEGYLCVLAGVTWFYSAMQWRVNYGGRRRLFFGLSLLLIVGAGWVVLNYFSNAYKVGSAGGAANGFFLEGTGRATFLALGGVATFAYAVEGFRHRLAMPLFGLPATLLCFAALYMGDARDGLAVYYTGILIWFVWSFWAGSLPRFLKWGIPFSGLMLALLFWAGGRSVEDVSAAFRFGPGAVVQVEEEMLADSLDLFLDSPVSGVGLGNFSSVFPQYRTASAGHVPVERPGSELLALATEGGLLSVIFLGCALWFYARRCRGFQSGGSAAYRRLAFVLALAFLGLGLVHLPAHAPGTLYLGLLFATLVLPSGAQPASRVPPLLWRIVGVVLLCFGLVWIVAGSLAWPFHSQTYQARLEGELASPSLEDKHEAALKMAEDWVDLRPLDWRAYSERARRRLLLGGDRGAVVADFERARFVEPLSGQVTFEEGLAWLDVDVERAIAAWELTLSRELGDRDAIFAEMLHFTDRSSNVLNGVSSISEQAPRYRAALLTHLKGANLMREIRRDLAKSPRLAHFDTEQRGAILENWIEHGDFGSAKDFVSAHAEDLPKIWWLESLVYKNQADFESAVDLIREHVAAPELLGAIVEQDSLARVSRQFSVQPNDTTKGFALLATYLSLEDYEKALVVVDGMLAEDSSPLQLYYWRAEVLYQLNEYIESWFAFREYLRRAWGLPVESQP
jgi:tetratricopeptide (TPR) repeat protein